MKTFFRFNSNKKYKIENYSIIQRFFCLLMFLVVFTPSAKVFCQTQSKKVFIHYMGWYGEGEYGRHWNYGHAHNPLIGFYDSKSWSAVTYHILMSWAAGIDGLVINIKDDYDKDCMRNVIRTIKKIHQIDTANFNYCISISYDDQGMFDVETAKNEFRYLRDTILTDSVQFLKTFGIPTIFAFNYPDQYLTAQDYENALSEIFNTNKPELIWNQFEASALGSVNSFYPWVGPSAVGWDRVNGLEWGEDYLNWFYPTVDANSSTLDFLCGGVWPGFDDRPNTVWGDGRWMDRQDGYVYNETWAILTDYSGELPAQYALIETWNDWNEGTEIEPGEETGYQYLKLTVNNINAFKGTDLSDDTVKFEAARQIYIASDLLEKNSTDSIEYYSTLELAIVHFLQSRFEESYLLASELNNLLTTADPGKKTENTSIEIFPNPGTYKSTHLRINAAPNANTVVVLLDLYGREVTTLFSGKVLYQTDITFNVRVNKGVYFIVMHSGNKLITQKLVYN